MGGKWSYSLIKEIRCPKCTSGSLASSNARGSQDLQHYIMDEMEGEGVSEEKKAELQKKHDAVIAPVFEPIFIASGILVKD